MVRLLGCQQHSLSKYNGRGATSGLLVMQSKSTVPEGKQCLLICHELLCMEASTTDAKDKCHCRTLPKAPDKNFPLLFGRGRRAQVSRLPGSKDQVKHRLIQAVHVGRLYDGAISHFSNMSKAHCRRSSAGGHVPIGICSVRKLSQLEALSVAK